MDNQTTQWPKYYHDQIIVPNPDGHIAIVTGWTKREKIAEQIKTAGIDGAVSAIGQLYSKEGINFIIRNIYLNPKIITLIFTGRDLSGGSKFFIDFLETSQTNNIFHSEIPADKIKNFWNWFSGNYHVVPEEKLIEFLANLPKKSASWIDRPENLPDPKPLETTSFPSEEIGFRLEAEKIADLWLKALDRIIKFGAYKKSQYNELQKELMTLITIINGEDPDQPYLPDWLYFTRKDLDGYYPQLMTAAILPGVEYTYGSRLRNYNGINQIEKIILELKKENYSRRAVAFTWNVASDAGNPKSPCLDLIQALVQNNQVYMTAYFRSNDMYRAWPQNSFALRKIQQEIASGLNLKMGKFCIISNSAHIYERDLGAAEEHIIKHKPMIECIHDPRGNFEIKTTNQEIIVNYYSPQAVAIKTFHGLAAADLRQQIYPFISDITHAIYLGEQLMKAELAIKNKKDYYQD